MTKIFKEFAIAGLHDYLFENFNLLCMPKNARILDYGCGSGAWLNRLQNAGYNQLMGIDIAQDNFGLDPKIFRSFDINNQTWDFDCGKFDFISSIEVLEHIENIGKYFETISNILKYDGVFWVTTPNVHSLLTRIKFFLTGNLKGFEPIGEPTHIYPMVLQNLKRLLPRYNLQIDRMFFFPDKDLSFTSKPSTILLTRIFRLFISDSCPGDIICLQISHKRD